MRKILIANVFILIGVLFLYIKPLYAQIGSMMGNENAITQTQTEGDMHTESVETVLQDIFNQQDISTVQELDLSKISDDEWERLGDAVMELRHPGEAHEAMDQMMGGEGSDSLQQIHINMGKAYLGYGENYGQGMMGGGMMPMMSMMMGGGGNSMMGSFGANSMGTFGWGFGWIFMILFWVLVVLGVVALIRWMANQGKNQRQYKSAIEILKERYAKGEIDTKEFEEKKKELS